MPVTKYKVIGMDCASCASIIKKKVSKIDGVKNIEINFATETAQLESQSAIPLHILNNEISKLGYQLHTPDHTMHTAPSRLDMLQKKVSISIPLVLTSLMMMVWENFFPYPDIVKVFFHHLLPIIATYMLFVIGISYVKAIFTFAKYKVANMDTLIGIGTTVAFFYSFFVSAFEKVLASYINVDQVYYDVTIVVIGFITLGKYLEARSKQKTGDAIAKLLNLQVKTALKLVQGKEVEVAVSSLQIGDILIIKPGSKVPLDGIITFGESSIDESMITGESLPVDKKSGDSVVGGTLNLQGSFNLKVTQTIQNSVLSQIIKVVEKAQGSHANVEKLTDKISSIFVPTILVISILTLLIWSLLGNPLQGILGFVGILVIACPCALGLATPTAIITGVGRAASMGILIKDAQTLEKLHRVKSIILDKTGTLTKGKPTVTRISGDQNGLKILSALESRSQHPLAQAVLSYAKQNNIPSIPITHFKSITGMGVTAQVKNKKYFAGNARYIESLGIKVDDTIIRKFARSGATPIILCDSHKPIVYVGISDAVKEESASVVNQLHKSGLKVVMLSGDHELTVKHIALMLGIDQIYSGVTPALKADIVQQIKNSLPNNVYVAMVGDGINDAPALATADVGIAMSTGTDIAIESSGVILLGGDLTKLTQVIRLSRSTFSIIKQNLFWAFCYNILGIPIAAGLLYPLFRITLNPALAGAAMAFSSVSVVTNSLRLKYTKL